MHLNVKGFGKMKISHLITHLEALKEREGDLPVYCLHSTLPINDEPGAALTDNPYRTTVGGFIIEQAPNQEKCVRILP